MGRGIEAARWSGLLAALGSYSDAVGQAPAGTAPPAAGGTQVLARHVVPRFESVPRDSFPVNLGKDTRIETGYLVVYEDRARPAGRTIRLPVAIVRSQSAAPAPDPVVYTAGGPGGSSLSAAQYAGAYRFLDTRDLIVVEQRGTRHARPALECPEVGASKREGAIRSLDAAGRAALDADAAARCRARLVAEGVDPAAYTTAASAADLEDLRRVLRVPRWNLYGVSYSTRVMLAVLRDHGAAVRSAVLDSPLPPTVRYDDASAGHFAQALDAVLRDCEAQPVCRAAYPDLRARFYAALAAADARPLALTVRSPVDSSAVPLALRGEALARLVALDNAWALPYLPRMMDRIARRDTAALREAVERTLSPDGGFAWGMRYSVWCAEEAPYARRTPAAAQRGSRPELAGVDPSPAPPAVCAAWRVPPAPPRDTAAVRSAVPVLLLSGAYDPETPPAWAAAAARTLPNARALTLRGMTHAPTQMWDAPCAMQAAAAFVDDPARDPAAGPAGACLAALRPPAFITPQPRPPRAGTR
jgi:pimeloyl-ACP methyl ester carboxylesterase